MSVIGDEKQKAENLGSVNETRGDNETVESLIDNLEDLLGLAEEYDDAEDSAEMSLAPFDDNSDGASDVLRLLNELKVAEQQTELLQQIVQEQMKVINDACSRLESLEKACKVDHCDKIAALEAAAAKLQQELIGAHADVDKVKCARDGYFERTKELSKKLEESKDRIARLTDTHALKASAAQAKLQADWSLQLDQASDQLAAQKKICETQSALLEKQNRQLALKSALLEISETRALNSAADAERLEERIRSLQQSAAKVQHADLKLQMSALEALLRQDMKQCEQNKLAFQREKETHGKSRPSTYNVLRARHISSQKKLRASIAHQKAIADQMRKKAATQNK